MPVPLPAGQRAQAPPPPPFPACCHVAIEGHGATACGVNTWRHRTLLCKSNNHNSSSLASSMTPALPGLLDLL